MARIIFMGTPEFAVPVLDALTKTNHRLVAVYTRLDKPAGRGGKLAPSPVKRLAASRALPIFQPKSLRKEEEITRLHELRPDLIVVSAYGLILPRTVLAIPTRGCLNTHASLLPRHRGAAPISAAIMAGDSEAGVTLMQMDEGIDTGPVLARRAIPITRDDTTGSLTTKLSQLAAELLIEHLPRILAGEVASQTQDESRATYAKMIEKEQGLIDWNLSAEEIARRVRAFNPWPSAYTFWNGTQLKILRAEPSSAHPHGEPGTVVQVGKEIAIVCGRKSSHSGITGLDQNSEKRDDLHSGALILHEVQLAGKRAMGIEEFVRGQRGFVGGRLTK